MKTSWTDRITLFAMIIIAAYGINEVLGYLIPGSLEASVTMLIIETAFVLIAVAAWRGRLPWLNIVIAGFSFVLGNTTNYAETTHYNWGFWVQMGVAAVSAICGTVLMLRKKEKHKAVPARELILCALICACALAVWGGWTMKDKKATGIARHTMWAVPTELDSVPCENAGTLEELIYETKAYGTDSRTLNKRALVYLPYGYDESEKYNILYLMHGTGDDENYWLSTHETNKTMLDNMIARGDIEPLIIVTPTFYVEDDLKDTGLDPLTYSFREELRNDLMPAVESKYSTWAETADAEGFAQIFHLGGNSGCGGLCCFQRSPGVCRAFTRGGDNLSFRILRQSGLVFLVRNLQRKQDGSGVFSADHSERGIPGAADPLSVRLFRRV